MDLIIFDNDGVLVDSEPIACDVLARLLTELGLPTTYGAVLDEYLGGSIERTRSLVEAKLRSPLPPRFEQTFHARLFARLDSELHPMPDVAWAIEQLDARICVASSGTLERIRRSLSIAGLADYFEDNLFSAEVVHRGKPSPDLFLHAAEVMGSRPKRTVVIEDSPLGIQAANAAGMHSIGFAALTPRERLSGASAGVISAMRDLPSALENADFLKQIEPGDP